MLAMIRFTTLILFFFLQVACYYKIIESIVVASTDIACSPPTPANSFDCLLKKIISHVNTQLSVQTVETDMDAYLQKWTHEIEYFHSNPRPNWQEYHALCEWNYANLWDRFEAVSVKLNAIIEDCFPIEEGGGGGGDIAEK